MRITDKPAQLPQTKVDQTAQTAGVSAVEAEDKADASPAQAGFDGTSSDPVQRPVVGDAAGGPLAVRLGNVGTAPTDPIVAHVLPAGAASVDLAGITDVAEALALVPNAELLQLARDRFAALQAKVEGTPGPDSLGEQFIDIGRLVPGQTRISIQRGREKVAKQVEYDGFVVSDGEARPAFDDGRATVPLAVKKPVVLMPGGRALVLDGNHQLLASLLAGAERVPVDVVADMSDLGEDAFWERAGAEGWTYLNQMGGAPGSVAEASYTKLDDDPLRMVMTEVALKAAVIDGKTVYEDSSRLDSRVWVKLKGPTVDFIEFKLADVLYREADKDPAVAKALDGDLPSRAKVSRDVLRAAAERGEIDPAAMGILLLDGSESLDDISSVAKRTIESQAG
jgi:hypothetical protein